MPHDQQNPSNWYTFATRPERVSWMRLRRHLAAMPGASLVDVCCDYMCEAAIVFVYAGRRFAVELKEDRFEFSVAGSNCPEEAKDAVMRHADEMLACPTPAPG